MLSSLKGLKDRNLVGDEN